MPRTSTELAPSPRTARAAPEMLGAVAITPGMLAISARTCCHCTIDRTRCAGRSTVATTDASPVAGGQHARQLFARAHDHMRL